MIRELVKTRSASATARSLKKCILIFAAVFAMTPGLFAQRSFVEPSSGDPARELFNTGQSYFDQFRYADAEKTFREVIARYSRSTVADKAEYYLIRTLCQIGRTDEALNRINLFPKAYPKSSWNGDVEELKMQLTNVVSAKARTILVQPFPQILFPPSTDLASMDVQISMMQETLRAMFRVDVPQALQITNARLKANLADPVVLSALPVLAMNASPQGLPFLVDIAKNSPSLKARKDAIYWMSRAPGDKDSVVDTLMGLLPGMNEDGANAITFALGQMIRTDKAYNALAGIVIDKMRSDKLREDALVALGQNHDPRTVTSLANIATGDTDIRFRTEALTWLAQIHSPEATQVLENLLRKK